MACRKMNEDVAYARNTESGCKDDNLHNIRWMFYNNKFNFLSRYYLPFSQWRLKLLSA